MKAKMMGADPRNFTLVFETGDEVSSELIKFAKDNDVRGAHFAGVGACERVVLGFFDLEKKDYEKIPVSEQVEVTSLIGNIALYDREPRIHAHLTIGRRNGTALGGHLIEAVVRPTLEIFLTVLPAGLTRRLDNETNLPMLDLGAK